MTPDEERADKEKVPEKAKYAEDLSVDRMVNDNLKRMSSAVSDKERCMLLEGTTLLGVPFVGDKNARESAINALYKREDNFDLDPLSEDDRLSRRMDYYGEGFSEKAIEAADARMDTPGQAKAYAQVYGALAEKGLLIWHKKSDEEIALEKIMKIVESMAPDSAEKAVDKK